MAYRPRESVFGPPLRAWIPSLVYMASAVALAVFVLVGERSGSNSWIFQYVVAKDVHRVLSIRAFAIIFFLSALAAVARAGMRGVRIYADGVESRDVLSGIIPKLRRYRWPQIECIVLDQKSTIALDLWDGTRAFLPRVSDRTALADTLERVAAARAIPVRGGVYTPEELEAEASSDA